MDIITAHNLIACRADQGASLLPDGFSIESHPGLEPTVPLATAAVSLSGMIEDATNDADIDEAGEHFRALLNAGIFTAEQWADEAESVIQQVVEFGEQQGWK